MRTIQSKIVLIFPLIFIFAVAAPAQNVTSPECVRAKPTRILSKKVFPKTTFKLEKNQAFPFEYIGYETVKLKNGDHLIIKNYGCENYSLDFRFETGRFSGSLDRTRFWYQAAVQLLNPVMGGLRDPYLVASGAKALNSYIKNNKALKFNEEIDFGGTDIRDVVFLNKPKKRGRNRFAVGISFGTGPL